MPAIPVIQSDELAVSTGLVGELGGVELGAWIDWWRTGIAGCKRTPAELLRAGGEIIARPSPMIYTLSANAVTIAVSTAHS